MRNWKSLLLAAAVAAMLNWTAAAQAPSVKPIPGARASHEHARVIGFMTDFDVKDDAVGICKAVMDSVAPEAKVIDISHQVIPFNIAEGARLLVGAAEYFPDNAVFVVVVDPGVGSTRKAIAARSSRGQIFVLPDNGLITLVDQEFPIREAYEIANPKWMIGSGISSTFHGRDIFSPAGAHAARGERISDAGPALDVRKLVRLDLHNATVDAGGLHGTVLGTDGPFGNLVMNIPAEIFARLGYKLGDQVPATIGGKSFRMPFVKTFSDVPVGKELLFIDSRGRLSASINQRNFSTTYNLDEGAAVEIPAK